MQAIDLRYELTAIVSWVTIMVMLLVQLFQQFVDLGTGMGIDPGSRFVEQRESRFTHQGPSYKHALQLSSR